MNSGMSSCTKVGVGFSLSGLMALGLALSLMSPSLALAHGHRSPASASPAPLKPKDDDSANPPSCLDSSGNVLPIDNSQVLGWKTSTPNQYLARAHVHGKVVQNFQSENGHAHFEVELGGGNLEVIYNEEFGAIPIPTAGMTVEGCGDFINSFAATSQYPVSPDGAILHWVHLNPKGKGHPSGYLVMNGMVCGQDPGGRSSGD